MAYECFAAIRTALQDVEAVVHTSRCPDDALDFFGSLTCPVKFSLRDGLEAAVKRHRRMTGRQAVCYLPVGGAANPLRDGWGFESIEDFPNIVVSETVDNLCTKEFLQRYVAEGNFQACQAGRPADVFWESGIVDPCGHFTVLAANPFVILADYRYLGGLPLPQHWEDLLQPMYRNRIVMGGFNTMINSNILLYLHKYYGMSGVEKLALNVKDVWLHAHIGKRACTNDPTGGGIYVLPWAIARVCVRRGNSAIIWPEEGAWTQLMYALVKQTAGKELAALVQYVTGEGFGSILSENLFPSLHPAVKTRLPPGVVLQWLGWEYLRSEDIGQIRQQAAEVFARALCRR